ncbi:hypothetical protein DFJ74DRAFT_746178 [Hyaloraphidium curvatum]|nr:hypothetical protein DFJ74DRAFT_746178 [Hyaloraphidium curvatum]
MDFLLRRVSLAELKTHVGLQGFLRDSVADVLGRPKHELVKELAGVGHFGFALQEFMLVGFCEAARSIGLEFLCNKELGRAVRKEDPGAERRFHVEGAERAWRLVAQLAELETLKVRIGVRECPGPDDDDWEFEQDLVEDEIVAGPVWTGPPSFPGGFSGFDEEVFETYYTPVFAWPEDLSFRPHKLKKVVIELQSLPRGGLAHPLDQGPVSEFFQALNTIAPESLSFDMNPASLDLNRYPQLSQVLDRMIVPSNSVWYLQKQGMRPRRLIVTRPENVFGKLAGFDCKAIARQTGVKELVLDSATTVELMSCLPPNGLEVLELDCPRLGKLKQENWDTMVAAIRACGVREVFVSPWPGYLGKCPEEAVAWLCLRLDPEWKGKIGLLGDEWVTDEMLAALKEKDPVAAKKLDPEDGE